MEIESLRIDIRKSDISEEWLNFDTIVNINSPYFGRQSYTYRNIIDHNDFDNLFSIMMKYAEHEIREIVNKHHIAKLKQIKARK